MKKNILAFSMIGLVTGHPHLNRCPSSLLGWATFCWPNPNKTPTRSPLEELSAFF